MICGGKWPPIDRGGHAGGAAFGVTIYATRGGSYAAYGALAGILGATALGLVAPALGGASRLITAPCAPAASVLSAFAIGLVHEAVPADAILPMLLLLGLLAGVLQVVFGTAGLGRLIKYMPYPVVSGYLSGVGLYIVASQVPKMLGMPREMHLRESLAASASAMSSPAFGGESARSASGSSGCSSCRR